MTRDEAIKWVDDRTAVVITEVSKVRMIDADALYETLCHIWDRSDSEEFEQAVFESIANAPTVEVPTWMPCSERLPEPEKKIYWVCTDDGYQCQCRWTNINHFWTDLTTDWHWHIGDVPQYSKVVAWMPLPTPYMTADD